MCVSDIKYEERDVSSLCFFGLLLPGNEVVNVNQKKKTSLSLISRVPTRIEGPVVQRAESF